MKRSLFRKAVIGAYFFMGMALADPAGSGHGLPETVEALLDYRRHARELIATESQADRIDRYSIDHSRFLSGRIGVAYPYDPWPDMDVSYATDQWRFSTGVGRGNHEPYAGVAYSLFNSNARKKSILDSLISMQDRRACLEFESRLLSDVKGIGDLRLQYSVLENRIGLMVKALGEVDSLEYYISSIAGKGKIALSALDPLLLHRHRFRSLASDFSGQMESLLEKARVGFGIPREVFLRFDAEWLARFLRSQRSLPEWSVIPVSEEVDSLEGLARDLRFRLKTLPEAVLWLGATGRVDPSTGKSGADISLEASYHFLSPALKSSRSPRASRAPANSKSKGSSAVGEDVSVLIPEFQESEREMRTRLLAQIRLGQWERIWGLAEYLTGFYDLENTRLGSESRELRDALDIIVSPSELPIARMRDACLSGIGNLKADSPPSGRQERN